MANIPMQRFDLAKVDFTIIDPSLAPCPPSPPRTCYRPSVCQAMMPNIHKRWHKHVTNGGFECNDLDPLCDYCSGSFRTNFMYYIKHRFNLPPRPGPQARSQKRFRQEAMQCKRATNAPIEFVTGGFLKSDITPTDPTVEKSTGRISKAMRSKSRTIDQLLKQVSLLELESDSD